MTGISYGIENKVALVTGGTRGIGLEIARELLSQKAKVFICARKREGLDAAVGELKGGDSLLALPAHIAKEEDVEKLIEAVKSSFGRLDILINNVGMNIPTGSLVDTDLSAWNKIIESNLTGTFLVSRAAGRLMREQGSGKIVSISSIAGRKAAPAMGIYGIAKAGIEMMTRVLAAELAPHNIQVNAVAPSMVKTDFSKPFWANKDIHDMVVKTIPLGRLAESRDVVHPALFLASPGADFITGQILMTDGGATAV